MIHAARQRLSNYRLNSGNGVLVWNVLMLAGLGFVIFNLRSPVAQAVMGGTIVLAAILGYVIVPVARWRFALAVKVMNTVRWIGIIVLALNFFNLLPMPSLAVLGALAMLIWSLSASFWLVTQPGVLTARGQEELIRRYGDPESDHAGSDDGDFEDQPASVHAGTSARPDTRLS